MDWPSAQLAWDQDNLHFGYHAADPAPLDPLPGISPNIDLELPVDEGAPWRCDCFFCSSMSISVPDSWVPVTGPIPANPNQTTVTSDLHQPPLGGSIPNGQEPVPRKREKARKASVYDTPRRFPYYSVRYCTCELTNFTVFP